MYDTAYSASFGVQTAFHVARSRLVFTHDHTASSLCEVIGGGWISERRSTDSRNVFAKDVWGCSLDCGMCGDICLVEGGGHMEKQRMD